MNFCDPKFSREKIFENFEFSSCFLVSSVVFYRSRQQTAQLAAVAQLDRVFGYEPKGRGFESLQPYQKRSSPFGELRFCFITFSAVLFRFYRLFTHPLVQ